MECSVYRHYRKFRKVLKVRLAGLSVAICAGVHYVPKESAGGIGKERLREYDKLSVSNIKDKDITHHSCARNQTILS